MRTVKSESGRLPSNVELYYISSGTRITVSGYQGDLVLDDETARKGFNTVLVPAPMDYMSDEPSKVFMPSTGKIRFTFNGLISGTTRFTKGIYVALYK